MRIHPTLLLLLALLTGCATQPTLTTAAMDSSRAGPSTRADVEKVLGRPQRFETGPNGKSVAFYENVEQRRNQALWGPVNLHSRHFSVLYDAKFAVERTLLAAHSGKIQRGWRDRFGQPLDRAAVIAAMQEPVAREELVAKFGPPTVEMLTTTGGVMLGWVALEQRHEAWGGQERQILEVECDADGVVRNYHIEGTLDAGGKPRP